MSEKEKARRDLAGLVLDAGAVFGLALVVFGLGWIYRPLAPLAAGLFLAAGCWFVGYNRMRNRERE